MAESRTVSGNVPLASPADSFNWQAAIANQLRGSGRAPDVNYGAVTGGPTGSFGGGAIWNTVAPPSAPDMNMQPNVQPFQMTPRAPARAPVMSPGEIPPGGGVLPPSGGAPTPPPSGGIAVPPPPSGGGILPRPSGPGFTPPPTGSQLPTNRELIESARGISKSDRKWLNKLFNDPQNKGLADSRYWATADPAELQENIKTGGLNTKNQNILLNALRSSGIDFGPPPAAPTQNMTRAQQQAIIDALRGGGSTRLSPNYMLR